MGPGWRETPTSALPSAPDAAVTGHTQAQPALKPSGARERGGRCKVAMYKQNQILTGIATALAKKKEERQGRRRLVPAACRQP